jgi:hypothetical protein
MSRRFAIALVMLAISTHGAAPATPASSDVLDADMADEARPTGSPGTAPIASEPVTRVSVAAKGAATPHASSANPLWGIPLTQLSGTRDRPIFSPSRRPAPVASATEPAVARSPRKKEIQPPQLALVGTIASSDESYGIFIDPSTKAALRLKVGDDYQGWKLITIQGREVVMAKDERSAVLTLPPPGGQNGEVRLLPVSALIRR